MIRESLLIQYGLDHDLQISNCMHKYGGLYSIDKFLILANQYKAYIYS